MLALRILYTLNDCWESQEPIHYGFVVSLNEILVVLEDCLRFSIRATMFYDEFFDQLGYLCILT